MNVNQTKQRLATEILEILHSMLILEDLEPNSDDVLANMKTIKLVAALHDDIVLRLCKLTDRRRRTLGAPGLIRYMQKFSKNRAVVQRIDDKFNKLEAFTSQLEDYRNTRLAHIGDSSASRAQSLPSLHAAVCAAAGLVDAIHGERVEYRVVHLDLRSHILQPNKSLQPTTTSG